MVPRDAPHQGLVAEVERLDDILLADLLDTPRRTGGLWSCSTQVTDPHNVGAILRSAAAFGALGLVTQDRHARRPNPERSPRRRGGALETVPLGTRGSIWRGALDDMAEAGFWRIGLAGEAEDEISPTRLGPQRVAPRPRRGGRRPAPEYRRPLRCARPGCRSAGSRA